MFILVNTGQTPLGFPFIGIVHPGLTATITDEQHTDFMGRAAIRLWQEIGLVTFDKCVTAPVETPAETPADIIDDEDVDTAKNPNRPDKLKLIDELAALGVTESTRASEKKLKALIKKAKAGE